MDWVETKVVLPIFVVLTAWAVLLSSDAFVATIPYASVLATFDLLRTLATISGLVLAAVVYRNWRTQERAKRDAASAEHLLVAAYKAANATRSLRRQAWTFRRPITKMELRIFRDSYGPEDFRSTQILVDELRGRLAATRIVFGKNVASALLVVPSIFQRAGLAKKDLDYLSIDRNALSGVTNEQDEASEDWQMQAQKALESLGAFPSGGVETLSALLLNWQSDPGEKKIAAALDELEKQLAPYIRLAAKKPA
jgi:hypothetical protein